MGFGLKKCYGDKTHPQPDLTVSSPFRKKPTAPAIMPLAQDVWKHPRRVVRTVVDYNPWFGQAEILLVLSGVSGLMALAYGMDMVLLEVVLNFMLSVVSVYSMAWLLWLTGKPFGGRAGFAELSAAMVWPMVPAIAGTVVAFVLGAFPLGGLPLPDLIQGLFYLFSFHLMVETIAEVQGFGAWNSFWSQMLALLISLLPLLLFWGQLANLFRALPGL
ncbi:MAG: Yip1 family protein [Candidatus Melainabacteria bacterium]